MTWASSRAALSGRTKRVALLLAGLILLTIIAANAHLVWVAVTSQPECVPHIRSPGADGAYRAARSNC